ncbi:MAG: putative CXXCH cytochrome family protein [Chlamydiales bacterium]|jgi:predicted CXXCH cytochrome family protein
MGTQSNLAYRSMAILGGCLLAACGSSERDTSGTSAPSDAPPDRVAGQVAGHALAPPWSAPPSSDASGRCIDCHTRIALDWSRTGMARTLGPVTLSELEGLGAVADAPVGYSYAFENHEGNPSIVETHAGAPQHELRAELVLAIGSGERDRSFAALQGDFLWLAPLEALTTADGRRHSELAPSHSITPGSRFSNPITGECLGCHTDAPPPEQFPLNLHSEITSTGARQWEPRGISCGACHGPVERHARMREEHSGADPILRIAQLSRIERLSICAACHLQGDARVILKPGQLGPPRPGGDLLEGRAVFVASRPDQDVGFVSQVQRLLLSECFLQSDTMVCGTCHDPHRTLHDDTERRRVRDACMQCHIDGIDSAGSAPDASPCGLAPSARPPAADCASCHMRRTGVFDVAEVQIHDHFIRRDPGPPSAPKPLHFAESPQAAWKRFTWPGEPPPEDVDDAGIWMMGYYARSHIARASGYMDRPVSARVERLPMYHHVRGSLLEGAGRIAEARAAYEHALVLDPATAPSAINLGLLLGNNGDPRAGLRVLDELLARFPKADGALRNRALLHHKLGDLEGFARDLTAAHRLHPHPALAATLGSLAEQGGDPAGARAWRQTAHDLDPLHQPAPR